MPLSGDEAKTLAALLKKKDEPAAAPPGARNMNFSIDLADEAQIERARKLGLIDWITGGDDPADEPPADEPPADEPPKRKGFFPTT